METELETSIIITEQEDKLGLEGLTDTTPSRVELLIENEDVSGLEGMTNTNPSGVELLTENEDANLEGIDEEVMGGEKIEDAPEEDTLGFEGITNTNPSGAELLIETDEEGGFEPNVNVVSVEDDEEEEDEPAFDSKVNGLKGEIELDKLLLLITPNGSVDDKMVDTPEEEDDEILELLLVCG